MTSTRQSSIVNGTAVACVGIGVVVCYYIRSYYRRKVRDLRQKSKLRVHIFPSVYRNNPKNFKYLADLIGGNEMELTFGPKIPAPTKGSNISSVEVVVGKTSKEISYDSLIGYTKQSRGSLRYVVLPYAGPPKKMLEDLKRLSDVRVYNSHHNASITAEYAVALLLAAAKRIRKGDIQLRAHNWYGRGLYSKGSDRPIEPAIPQLWLRGKTGVVVGYGAVGRKIANVLLAFGMKIFATRRSSTVTYRNTKRKYADNGGVIVVSSAELLHVLRGERPHVLMLCVPETPETVDLIGKDELDMLSQGSVLVNVARGVVVNEDALYRHLLTHQEFTAALDVWYQYPDYSVEGSAGRCAPSNKPFESMENVLLSPHRAGGMGNREIEEGRLRGIAEILRELARGRECGAGPVLRPMSLSLGY